MELTKQHLITELNRKVNHYVHNDNLFAGGCCFAAAEIAKNLEQVGISYNVIVFMVYDGVNRRSIDSICKADECGHVEIVAKVDGVEYQIGDYSRFTEAMKKLNFEVRVKKYRKIDSKKLTEVYNKYDWNSCWKREKNEMFSKDISSVFKKYLS